VRVDPDVWDKFVSWVVETEGQKRGELGRHVENALEEYIDNDRNARIEEKVDKVLAHVSEEQPAHTRTSRSSDMVEKARSIYKRLADNHGTVIKQNDVVRAIEDIAGADPRTVDKYKGVLKRRSLLFEFPGDSPVWTVERERWVTWAENYINNNPTIEAADVVEEYGITSEEFHEFEDETVRQ